MRNSKRTIMIFNEFMKSHFDFFSQAGISHDQLMLALEPEAASIHCRRVPVGVQTEGDGRKIIAAMAPGAKFIVLDQGGTVLHFLQI